jgi:hypothetical protein
MTINKRAFSSALAALAAAGAIAAAPVASAVSVDPGPLVAGPTEIDTAVNPAPPTVTSGAMALPPDGSVAVFPQEQSIDGTNPEEPLGVDPSVPFGVWTP